jgi:hypothetical protein
VKDDYHGKSGNARTKKLNKNRNKRLGKECFGRLSRCYKRTTDYEKLIEHTT